jgi:hypothetical protein
MISGFTVARNVVKLGYPASESISSARALCDEYILSYDPRSDDFTADWAKEIAEELDLTLFESEWEVMENGQMWYDGLRDINEIARQTAKAAAQCNHEWNLYVQLDEGFHEDDHEAVRLSASAPPDVTGIDFLRMCFYGNLHTIRMDWSVPCTRMVRKGTHEYLVPGGGMSAAPKVGRHIQAPVWMWHYVRMGDPMAIARRVRNLDTFYHDPKTLIPEAQLQPYDFEPREFDNTSLVESEKPKKVVGNLKTYRGTHPPPFAELYQEWK